VADQHQRATARTEFAFQPFDGGEVEVVGRLVQQQDVGRGRQHTGERRAARFAAGELRRVLVAVQPELFEQVLRGIGIVAGAEPGFDISERGGEAVEIRLLW